MVKILLDTNAVLDLVFNRYQERHDAMLAAISHCRQDSHELLVCAHTLCDMTYILQNNAGMKNAMPDPARRRECARHARETVFRFCIVCSIDEQTCMDAHYHASSSDFEDSLVFACAKANGAEVIVTSNKKAFDATTIRALTPKEFADYVGGS